MAGTTAVRYNPHTPTNIDVLRNNQVAAVMALEAFCSLDSDLRDAAARAMANPGSVVPIPSMTRGPRPRNSRIHAVAL